MIAGRSTRMEVLELLRRKGRSSAESIANDLGVTPNADAEKFLDPKLVELYKEGFAPDADIIKRAEWIERNDKTAVTQELLLRRYLAQPRSHWRRIQGVSHGHRNHHCNGWPSRIARWWIRLGGDYLGHATSA